MSVTDVIETAARGSDHKHERTFAIRHEFTREFIVRTNNGDDNAIVVKKGQGVPRIGDSFGSGTDAICQEVAAERDLDNNMVWHVTVNYLSLEPDEHDEQTNEKINNEVMQPPKIRTGFIKYQKPAHTDVYGNPVVNSAGDPFTPRPMREAKTLWVEVSRYEHDSDGLISANRYCDTVNADTFWGCMPGTVKLADIRGERLALQTAYGWFYYWRVMYLFHFRRDDWGGGFPQAGEYRDAGGSRGWIKSLVDSGLNELADKPLYSGSGTHINGWIEDGTTKPIVDKITESPVTTPVRLNGLGHPLAKPQDKTIVLDFTMNVPTFFNWLNMPPLLIKL